MYLLSELEIPFTTFQYTPFGGTDYSFLSSIKNPIVFGTWGSLMDMWDLDYPLGLSRFDMNNFKCSTYLNKLQDFVLQNPHREVKRDNFKGWLNYITEYRMQVNDDTLVIVSRPVPIETEWRFVLVNGKVVGGSQYKSNFCLEFLEIYPEEAAYFAEQVARHWTPHPIFVMDIGLVNGDFKVIEIGPFNYAGLYKMDLKPLVLTINKFAEFYQ